MQIFEFLSSAGEAIDTPGAYSRGLLGGRPGEKLTGREMLENWGLLGENTPGLDIGDVAGFAAEMLNPLDPLNILGYLTGGWLGKALGRSVAGRRAVQGGIPELAKAAIPGGIPTPAMALDKESLGLLRNLGKVGGGTDELHRQMVEEYLRSGVSNLGDLYSRRMQAATAAGDFDAWHQVPRQLFGTEPFSIFDDPAIGLARTEDVIKGNVPIQYGSDIVDDALAVYSPIANAIRYTRSLGEPAEYADLARYLKEERGIGTLGPLMRGMGTHEGTHYMHFKPPMVPSQHNLNRKLVEEMADDVSRWRLGGGGSSPLSRDRIVYLSDPLEVYARVNEARAIMDNLNRAKTIQGVANPLLGRLDPLRTVITAGETGARNVGLPFLSAMDPTLAMNIADVSTAVGPSRTAAYLRFLPMIGGAAALPVGAAVLGRRDAA